MPKLFFRSIIIVLAGLGLFLIFSYVQGKHWQFLFGSLPHKLSRLHPVFVHLSVGCVFLAALTDSYLAWKNIRIGRIRKQFFSLGLFLLLVTFNTGLLMQVIERYPNERIHTHMIWAASIILLYLLAIVEWSLKEKFKFFTYVLSAGILVALFQTAHIGGEIYKGTGYFRWPW